MNFNETKKLNFLRLSLFKDYLAGSLIVRWLDQPSTQNLLWNIILNGIKIQPVDRIFFQVERAFLVRHVHQKLAFLTHLIANAWAQNMTKKFKAP